LAETCITKPTSTSITRTRKIRTICETILQEIIQKTNFYNNPSIISPEKKLYYGKKRALRYIHPRTLYVGFTVRVGAKLRGVRVRVGVRIR